MNHKNIYDVILERTKELSPGRPVSSFRCRFFLLHFSGILFSVINYVSWFTVSLLRESVINDDECATLLQFTLPSYRFTLFLLFSFSRTRTRAHTLERVLFILRSRSSRRSSLILFQSLSHSYFLPSTLSPCVCVYVYYDSRFSITVALNLTLFSHVFFSGFSLFQSQLITLRITP